MACGSEGRKAGRPRVRGWERRRGADDRDLGRKPPATDVGVQCGGSLSPGEGTALLARLKGSLLGNLRVRRICPPELVDRLASAPFRLLITVDETALGTREEAARTQGDGDLRRHGSNQRHAGALTIQDRVEKGCFE